MKVKKAVLAYSGGLDTSIMITWLKEHYGCEVIAVCADLGQGDDMKKVYKKAMSTGASKCYVADLKKEFVKDFIFPTLRASAVYEGKYLLGTSHARPLIAKHQMAIAKKENADAVAHGATGKGNDQVRFELTYFHCDPKIKIIAPWKDERWTMRSREEAIDYAKKHKIPISQTKKKIYSEDGNLWHLSHEGAELEDPWNEPKDTVYTISNTPEKAPNKPEHITIGFEKGNPVKINGRKMGPVALVEKLNRIGAKHAIGHCDMVENRLVGMKSRGVYETPGGSILYYAHDELERLVLDKDTCHYKKLLAEKYAELVYNGQWYTPLRTALDAFVSSTQKNVTGDVRLKLYKGSIRPAGSKSPYSLYSIDLSSFTDHLELYDQKDAKGFIRLFGLPITTAALMKKKKK